MKRLAIAAAIAAIAMAMTVAYFWRAPGPLTQDFEVLVTSGSSLSAVADRLEDDHIIVSARLFRVLARLFGPDAPIRAGEFRIPAGSSASAILDILQNGQPILRFITIPEGWPSILVYERLLAEPLLVGEIEVPEEGSVLPDSYSFERGETRAAVIERMQKAMMRTLEALWPTRTAAAMVRTPQEAVNLAAIVEKETAKPEERRMIAGVYTNRLRIGMMLQADPTVIYPITKGKPLGRRIRQSELRADNGYNTYAKSGLPRGPIANPGRESLAAVLDPAETDALYFVADGTGGHVFSRTLAEHNANVLKWRAIRRERGEL